jgi:D-sedoheptulose 7-phosphate isomerase
MRKFIEIYYKDIFKSLDNVKASDKNGQSLDFYNAIEQCCGLILKQTANSGKIMFIGNGASAAIAGHMAADFLKNGEMPAMAFNEASLLTCLSNDLGYIHVFEKPIEMFGSDSDILVAISSSGRSENILRGVNAARIKGCHIITLSGFDQSNPLFKLGDYNFHVPIHSYGAVEVVHHSICHCIIDVIMKSRS